MTDREIIDLIDENKEHYLIVSLKSKDKDKKIRMNYYYQCLCLLKKEIQENLKNKENGKN
jgi:hypothetical protein